MDHNRLRYVASAEPALGLVSAVEVQEMARELLEARRVIKQRSMTDTATQAAESSGGITDEQVVRACDAEISSRKMHPEWCGEMHMRAALEAACFAGAGKDGLGDDPTEFLLGLRARADKIYANLKDERKAHREANARADAAIAVVERLRDAVSTLRSHLKLLVGPDDAIANAVFEVADTALRAAQMTGGDER